MTLHDKENRWKTHGSRQSTRMIATLSRQLVRSHFELELGLPLLLEHEPVAGGSDADFEVLLGAWASRGMRVYRLRESALDRTRQLFRSPKTVVSPSSFPSPEFASLEHSRTSKRWTSRAYKSRRSL